MTRQGHDKDENRIRARIRHGEGRKKRQNIPKEKRENKERIQTTKDTKKLEYKEDTNRTTSN